jgi:hypothetical protein
MKLTDAGVEFIAENGAGPGVRLREPKTLVGSVFVVYGGLAIATFAAQRLPRLGRVERAPILLPAR